MPLEKSNASPYSKRIIGKGKQYIQERSPLLLSVAEKMVEIGLAVGKKISGDPEMLCLFISAQVYF